MDIHEQKLREYLTAQGIAAEHMSFEQSCHSVAAAAEAVGAAPEDLIKSICLIDEQDRLIVAIVKGEDRVSRTRVGKALGIAAPRLATPEEMLDRTGYPAGGTPPFGFAAVFLIDPRVFEKDVIYGGGGSDRSLIKVAPSEIQRINQSQVARVRS